MKPLVSIKTSDLALPGMDIADIGVQVGFGKTKSEIRRHIKAGAIRICDIVVKDPFARLAIKDNKWVLVEDKES
jgi:uncharacterized protein (DUF1786 family)